MRGEQSGKWIMGRESCSGMMCGQENAISRQEFLGCLGSPHNKTSVADLKEVDWDLDFRRRLGIEEVAEWSDLL